MAFVKGDPRINREGRIGPNNSTKMIKEAFAMLVENNLPNMGRWLNQIAADDPAKAVDIIIKLSERFVPSLARTEITAKDGDDLFKQITFNFGPALNSAERIQIEDGTEFTDLEDLQ